MSEGGMLSKVIYEPCQSVTRIIIMQFIKSVFCLYHVTGSFVHIE